MCLVIDKQLKAKVARRNFVVSKYLRFVGENVARSPFRGFCYILDKEYKVRASFSTRKSAYKKGDTIHVGLHSFVKNNRRVGVGGEHYYAIIPKGAFYIVGRDNDIVSNRLIVKKKIIRKK